MTATRLRGAKGYLEGDILKPSPPATANVVSSSGATTSTGPTPSEWSSTSPSVQEWDQRDAWVLGLIQYNTKNAIGLGVKLDGSAAQAWKSLTDIYDNISDLAKINIQRELRDTRFLDGNDFSAHVANLRTLWTRANSAGSNISDTDFRTIILTSLPETWDTIVATLYDAKSSADAIARLDMHWSRINRNGKVSTATSSSVALQANAKPGGNVKRCANTNCKRKGHVIEDCYWPGGGKEGQFPPGFGKRGGASGNATGTASAAGTGTASATANAAIIETAYALMADLRGIQVGDPDEANNGMLPVGPGSGLDNVWVLMAGGKAENVQTYVDSGASDHCFVNKSDFSAYVPFSETREGQAACRGAKFRICGKGTVVKTYMSKGKQTKLTFNNALHTPDFAANLISVGRFDAAGFRVVFNEAEATFFDPNGHIFISAPRLNGMYSLSTCEPVAMPARSHEHPTNIDLWHRRLAHTGVSLIENMAKKKLVDGLQVTSEERLPGMCEDCVLGKHTSRPYDEHVIPETIPLARVHVDLWGPARVQSIGGAKYLLVLTDDATSFRKAYFLSEKTADATLHALKEYRTEAELQTGQKLKHICSDNGKEFINNASEEWCRAEGIIQETPAPYAHAGNGVAERTNRTVIEGTRCLLCDSQLPPSLWADAAQTVVYTRNLIPSSRHPDLVPAEAWTGKRQDISHLRPFGCSAYAKIPKEVNPSKIGPTSEKYQLIGYYGRDAYKLYDRASGKVYKSRDVIFEEGTGHRTVPLTSITNDDEDYHVFPGNTNSENTTTDSGIVPGHVIREPAPIAPRQTPYTHPAAAQSSATLLFEPQQPAPLPAPPLRRSSRPTRLTTAMKDSQISEQQTREAREAGLDWATDKARPRAMKISEMDDLHCELDTYISSLYTNPYFPDVALLAYDPETYLPRNHVEAFRHPELWLEPMEIELFTMEERNVFTKVQRPPNRNVIEPKWVYALKLDAEGEVLKRKARLVAKGFTQIPGLDFDQTYASVARLESVRMTAAIMAHFRLYPWQIDFVAAYLNSDNAFEVYMEQPPGFVTPGEEDMVLRCNKTVYGMMQGAYDWETELSKSYDALGYYQSRADPCVRHRHINGQYTITCTYTDDVLGGSTSKDEEEKAITGLEDCYEVKRIDDNGRGKAILGMGMVHNPLTGSISLSQRPFAERTLKRFNMQDCNPKATPLPTRLNVHQDLDDPLSSDDIAFMKDKPYREALGSIMWLQVGTRPDLSFAVNVLSRYQSNPGPIHWKMLVHVLAYIKGTVDYKIVYSPGTSDGLTVSGFADSDYAGDEDNSRSTDGNVFTMAGGPVSWSSKRQPVVAKSTTEAEYYALARACQQAVWMTSWMGEAGLPQESMATLYGDNKGSVDLSKNTRGVAKAKHIRVNYHFVRERVKMGEVDIIQIPTENNLADIFTKPLPRETHLRFVKAMGLSIV